MTSQPNAAFYAQATWVIDVLGSFDMVVQPGTSRRQVDWRRNLMSLAYLRAFDSAYFSLNFYACILRGQNRTLQTTLF